MSSSEKSLAFPYVLEKMLVSDLVPVWHRRASNRFCPTVSVLMYARSFSSSFCLTQASKFLHSFNAFRYVSVMSISTSWSSCDVLVASNEVIHEQRVEDCTVFLKFVSVDFVSHNTVENETPHSLDHSSVLRVLSR